MKPMSTFTEIRKDCLVHIQTRKSVLLRGAAGIGKSEFVYGLAQELSIGLVEFRATLLEPVDLRGLPSVANGITVWNVPSFLPVVERDGDRGILFIDELLQAPMATQLALFQLTIKPYRLGDYQLPTGWTIFSASNRREDKSGASRMPLALANRFAHYTVDVDLDAYLANAVRKQFAPEILAFNRFRPALLHVAPVGEELAFPTPRGYEALSDACKVSHPDQWFSLARSILGEPTALEFSGFLNVYRHIPKPDTVISDPQGAVVPTQPDQLCAIASALARKASPTNLSAILTYLARLPEEYEIMCVHDAITRDETLKVAKGYAAFRAKHVDVDL
jgi:hypothetical protein